MKQAFIEKTFKGSKLELLGIIEKILDDYSAQGYDLSLRQLFYQGVSRGIIPNTTEEYKKLGDLVSDARLAGLLDWDMIVDRGRTTVSNNHWESPADIVRAAAQQYRIEKWRDQPCHVEVFVEKQALEGVLIPVCRDLDVNFTANKGYSSQSHLYRVGQRLAELNRNKEVHLLYLGDHDPSGLDMDRDVRERLEMFSGRSCNLRRLALKYEQVEELNPPENPAKLTDSRAANYVSQYGESSWELDAVEPRALAKLVKDAVTELLDEDLWDAACERENKMREDLLTFARTYGRD